MGLQSVINTATSYAQQARSTLDKFGALTGRDVDNSEIRDRYLNGFFGDTTQFRPFVFSRLFDEPTYLTFRIEFDFSYNKPENISGINSAKDENSIASLDLMPEPLLNLITQKRGTDTVYEQTNLGLFFGKDLIVNTPTINHNALIYNQYSTYYYLKDALGDHKRAEMLRTFINELEDIQYNYPYYYTCIEGLNNLSQVNPEKGIRLNDDNNTITISCLEGLDMKITQMLQLYRKVVWDDVYQRWVLPDMMRFFTVRIYVSEIRLFHTSSKSNSAKNFGRTFDLNNSDNLNATSFDKLSKGGGGLLGFANNILNTASGMAESIFGPDSGIAKGLQAANGITDMTSSLLGALSGSSKMCDNAINDVMPTIMYECKMCEFDISDTLSHISSLSSSKEGLSAAAPEIKIKVGKVYEHMSFPLQKGLEIKGNKYTVEHKAESSDSKQIGNIFDDKSLRESGTRFFKEEIKDDLSISSKRRRMHDRYGETGEGDDSYTTLTPNKGTALTSLVGGVTSFFTSSDKIHKSAAVDGEQAEKARSMYRNNSDPIHNSEAVTTGENRQNDTPEHLHNSEAVTNGENKPTEKPEDLHKSESMISGKNFSRERSQKLHRSESILLGEDKQKFTPEELHESDAVNKREIITDITPENLYLSAAVTEGEQKPIEKSEELHHSEAVTEGEKKFDIIPEKLHKSESVTKGESQQNIKSERLHESTATPRQRKKIQRIIDEEGSENVLSAATSIKNMIKYIEDGDVIKSTATDEKTQNAMKEITIANALDSLSEATNPNSKAVQKLASIIKEEFLEQSTAANLSDTKRQNIIKNSFNYLNGN